jgi:hypothetical protein
MLLFVAIVVCVQSKASRADSPPPAPDQGGLPPQQSGTARLVLREAQDTDVAVRVKHAGDTCNDLSVEVMVRQGEPADTLSQCLSASHPQARFELFIGPESARQFYKVAVDYSRDDHTVAYTLKRVEGVGFIQYQRVVVDVAP